MTERGPSVPGDGSSKVPGPPRVSSRMLLQGQRELIIEHEQEEYRLRLTASNKLILIK